MILLDSVGTAGSSQRISLKVFAQTLIQYISVKLKTRRQILCSITGAHIFPSDLTYIPSSFRNSNLFVSCYCTVQRRTTPVEWEEDMAFFHTAGAGETIRNAPTRFRDSCMTIKLVRTATGGMLMPTKSLYLHLNKLKLEFYEEVVEFVQECVQYGCLYHHNGTFHALACRR